MMVVRDWGLGKWGNIGQKVQSCNYAVSIRFRDLIYSMVTIVNNTVLYT